MALRLLKEPTLEKPDLIASWPGIGNIGLIATDMLRGQTDAEEFAEIEPWEFFYPKKVIIKDGILRDLVFPDSKFYYKKLAKRDLIIFIGEEQPTEAGKMYAKGRKAYEMTNLVLDLAERFGCRRVYTSGAAVALTHHAAKPRVWAVTSSHDLGREIKSYDNTVLMDEVEGRGRQNGVTGLNGLLLGAAKRRGLEAVCLMGEIPDYLSAAAFPYPRAARSVLEVLSQILGIEINYTAFDGMAGQVDEIIGGIYAKLPSEIRERIDQRKHILPTETGAISEEDEKWIKEHIEELFRKRGSGDEGAA